MGSDSADEFSPAFSRGPIEAYAINWMSGQKFGFPRRLAGAPLKQLGKWVLILFPYSFSPAFSRGPIEASGNKVGSLGPEEGFPRRLAGAPLKLGIGHARP